MSMCYFVVLMGRQIASAKLWRSRGFLRFGAQCFRTMSVTFTMSLKLCTEQMDAEERYSLIQVSLYSDFGVHVVSDRTFSRDETRLFCHRECVN